MVVHIGDIGDQRTGVCVCVRPVCVLHAPVSYTHLDVYKRQVYHPSSNPAERVLREVGRILRTYYYDNQKEWQKYLTSTEEFLNIL